jgi:hypothetical protein
MHHVYVDHRADTGVPFYVGKGDRARTRDFKNRNVVWHRIVKKHGVRREIVLATSVHDIVLSEEVQLIRELKTRDYHGGANLTDGGEGSLGWDPTPENRRHMREAKLGKKLPSVHRANLKQAHIERYKLPGEREKTGERSRRVWLDPAYRERVMLTRVGERNGRAVVTEADVRQIRTEWETYDVSVRGSTKAFCVRHATRFGVTWHNVFGIVKRKSWKHVT